MKYNILYYFSFLVLLPFSLLSQEISNLTHADSLRGNFGKERSWWDAIYYNIDVEFSPADSSVKGTNIIGIKVLKEKFSVLQLDLQHPLQIDSIFLMGESISKHAVIPKVDGDAYFIPIPDKLKKNKIIKLIVYYQGRPKIASHPPWDGGTVWSKSKDGSPWISVACQGTGASVWYPCKDHQSDEPDSATIRVTCPDSLSAISNGRLKSCISQKPHFKTWEWHVSVPINNYCIIPYIGKYAKFSETYFGEKGPLTMDYWVLDNNVEKAKIHFTDAPKMMKAFEYWFGPYPFYKDGYKLVQAPYLGMEHQSAVAYGNNFTKGYLGMDLSGTGWGLKWDFIIIHESGHEWFANNITTKDIADMWVHEGFTNYSEALFIEYYYGKDAANEYVRGLRASIANDEPIIGPYNVNKEGSGDMYNKGSNMIHTIRQLIHSDKKFRKMLRKMNRKFGLKTVTSKEIEEFIQSYCPYSLKKVFEQYLHTIKIPVFEYRIKDHTITFLWKNCVEFFNMPLRVKLGRDKYSLIFPSVNPQVLPFNLDKPEDFKIDPNFYIQTQKDE